MPTLAGQTITSGSVRRYERGDWLADVATNSGTRIENGTRVELVIENVTLSGAIVRGNISGDVGRYLVSGRPEWDIPLPARARNAYRSSASVLLGNVLADILQDVFGSSWQSLVVLPPAARLGEHYERPGTKGDVSITGRDLLELLELPWYVRDDGITVFAERASGIVNPSDTPLIPYRNDALGLRTVMTEDPGAFVPGLTFEGEIIGEVVYSIRPEDITTYTWPRKTSNLFSDAIKKTMWRLFPRFFFQGVHEYTIAGTSSNGRHDLRSVGSRWLPDITLASFWTGAAGHRASLPIGTHVGVSFMNSDPSRPVQVCVEPITPKEVGYNHAPDSSLFYATDTIDVFAGDEVSIDAGEVNLGGAAAHVLRSGDAITIVIPGPGPPPPIAGTIFLTSEMLPSPVATSSPTRVKA